MFKCSHAQNTDWKTTLDDCLHNLGGNPSANIGFFYVTEPIAPFLSSILETLKADTGIEKWVGSVGMGICAIGNDEGKEYFDVPAIAVLTATLPPDSFEIMETIDQIEDEHGDEKIDENALSQVPPIILIHADCGNEQVLEIMNDIAIETEGYLLGALTLSEAPKHHVAESITGGGVSGLILNSKVNVVTALTQGCQPIGITHQITECSENFIIGLDGRNAVEVFQEDIGDILSRDLNKVAGFVHVALPVLGSDTGDYVVRNLLGVDPEEGVFAIAAPVEPGDQLMFVNRDSNTAQKDLAEMVLKLQKRAENSIKGGIYISCIARGPNMFGEVNAEIQIIKNILGNIPLIGLYANGEISNNRLYSYTGVLTLFT